MKKISELLSKLCLFARRLEEQINKGHFKLAEERRLVAETDRLKRSRRTLKEWQVKISGDTLFVGQSANTRQVNNFTCLAGPAYSRLIGYTQIYSANIGPAQEHLK